MNIKSFDAMEFGGNLLVAKPYKKQGYGVRCGVELLDFAEALVGQSNLWTMAVMKLNDYF